ncbi:hypothetical protein S245_060171, partial [Arachis hypogaea]
MFQLAVLSLACPWIQQQFERLTYLGISRSTLIFNSPSISLLTTPFLVSRCLGIHHNPFLIKLPNQKILLLSYSIALYRLSSRVGDKRTRTADIRHRNPILTKDSCGSGRSSYRRIENGELPFLPDSWVLRMP